MGVGVRVGVRVCVGLGFLYTFRKRIVTLLFCVPLRDTHIAFGSGTLLGDKQWLGRCFKSRIFDSLKFPFKLRGFQLTSCSESNNTGLILHVGNEGDWLYDLGPIS